MKNFVGKTRFSRSAWIRIAILAVLALAFLLLPVYLKNEYVMRIATLCVMYSALALTLNLITGVMGQVSLGHAAFMGGSRVILRHAVGVFFKSFVQSRSDAPPSV